MPAGPLSSIDVWKNPEQVEKYSIHGIPTQIFQDADGREVYRNLGFMDKTRIKEVHARFGIS